MSSKEVWNSSRWKDTSYRRLFSLRPQPDSWFARTFCFAGGGSDVYKVVLESEACDARATPP